MHRHHRLLAFAALVSATTFACSSVDSPGDRPEDEPPANAPATANGGAPGKIPGAQATPLHVSMFGQIDVKLTGKLGALGTIRSVTVDDIRALRVEATPTEITAYVQGAPSPGPAKIVITGTAGSLEEDAALVYDGPVGGAPMKWAAFGASLTQGFQSNGLEAHGQIMSVAAQVARAASVYLAPPLLDRSFLPPIDPKAFVDDCNASQGTLDIAGGALQSLANVDELSLDLRGPRLDPTLPTRNFAVGGAKVSDIIAPGAFPIGVIERITEQPDGDPTDPLAPPSVSQLERIERLDPDVAVCADLLANDGDGAMTDSDDLHPESMTDVTTIRSELDTLMARLGKLHGDYFIANLLPLDGLPNVAVLRKQNVPDEETAAEFDAKLAKIRAMIAQYNDALVAAAAPYPNVHVIDVWTPTTVTLANGLDVGGRHLTGHEFGGLLSLDFVHFTDTGYAYLANLFIDAINAAKGWKIPRVDLVPVLDDDELSPAELKAIGVSCPPI